VASCDPDELSPDREPEEPGPVPFTGVWIIIGLAVVGGWIAVAAGYALGRFEFAVGVLVGGALAVVNFGMMSRTAAKGLQTRYRWSGYSGLMAAIRWLGLGAALALSIWVFRVDVLGLLVGLTCIVAGILLAAATGLIKG